MFYNTERFPWSFLVRFDSFCVFIGYNIGCKHSLHLENGLELYCLRKPILCLREGVKCKLSKQRRHYFSCWRQNMHSVISDKYHSLKTFWKMSQSQNCQGSLVLLQWNDINSIRYHFTVENIKFYSHLICIELKSDWSHDVASGSDIMPCNEINKPLVFTDFVTLRNDVHYNVA